MATVNHEELVEDLLVNPLFLKTGQKSFCKNIFLLIFSRQRNPAGFPAQALPVHHAKHKVQFFVRNSNAWIFNQKLLCSSPPFLALGLSE